MPRNRVALVHSRIQGKTAARPIHTCNKLFPVRNEGGSICITTIIIRSTMEMHRQYKYFLEKIVTEVMHFIFHIKPTNLIFFVVLYCCFNFDMNSCSLAYSLLVLSVSIPRLIICFHTHIYHLYYLVVQYELNWNKKNENTDFCFILLSLEYTFIQNSTISQYIFNLIFFNSFIFNFTK